MNEHMDTWEVFKDLICHPRFVGNCPRLSSAPAENTPPRRGLGFQIFTEMVDFTQVRTANCCAAACGKEGSFAATSGQ